MNKLCGLLSLGACCAAFASSAATPVVGNVSMTQNEQSRLVTIQYMLTEAPGIVTVDIRTNGVSIGDANLHYFAGDVNRLVTNLASACTVTWQPDKSWPDHKITDSSVTCRVMAWATNAPPDYMVANLLTGDVRYYTSADALPDGGITNNLYKTDQLVMRKIPAANVEWTMGSAPGETGRDNNAETNQPVTLPEDYYIGVFQVTQGQWFRMMGTKPSSFGAFYDQYPGRPVENISYQTIRESANGANTANNAYWYPNNPNSDSFLGKLRKLTGQPFDLPSEAQWEYACRAGKTQDHWNDGSPILSTDKDSNLANLGRAYYNGGKALSGTTYSDPGFGCSPTAGTAVVGSYLPNAWGLYDMHGNVWEWCLDWYEAKHLYPNHDGAVNINGASGSPRLVRGGSWSNYAYGCRSACRDYYYPSNRGSNLGFRTSLALGL